jgi:two-component system cell cycle sensor histidine kinase PleC
VNLGEVLSASASQFRLMAQNANVLLDERIDRNLAPIKGDPVRLRQVFTNLISNALKFTTSGGSVSVIAEERPTRVVVTVRDTGVGMTEDEIAVALTPFGQVDASHTRWREGTGLGLPIARALVQLHSGELKISSVKGEGTSVEVSIPILHVDAAPGTTYQEPAA